MRNPSRHKAQRSAQLATLLLMVFSLLLSACENRNKNGYVAEYPFAIEQEGISTADFINSEGQVTADSQLLAQCTILRSEYVPACPLSKLNFIASDNLQQGSLPNKSQILSRLIVSDKWMADNFSLLLDNMPADMYQLFSSTTAIVIHRDIRPAYFWSKTGAIYLDPQYLWFTQAQFETISTKQDYRSDFASELDFYALYRYSLDGEFAFASGSERGADKTLYALSALLFHELAHATDFFPAAEVAANTDLSLEPKNLAQSLSRTSLQLQNNYPLLDDTWHQLANVMFNGEAASDTLSALSATDVGLQFATEGANDAYGYLQTPYPTGLHYEDTAMLFEEVMMKIHFNIDRELAFTTITSNSLENCTDLRVDWAQINRYREPLVLPRATLVVNRLLPDHQHQAFLAQPPAAGVYSYCSASATNQRRRNATENTQQAEPIIEHFWH